MKNLKFTNKIIILLFFALIPTMIYIVKFFNHPISNSLSDWGSFTTFFELSISLANIFLFVFITYEIHLYNKSKDERDSRPIISFYNRFKDCYEVENIGLRTAIDVIVYIDIENETKWKDNIRLYAIPPGEKIPLEKVKRATQICATYFDVNGKKYFSFIDGSRLRFFDDKTGRINYKDDYQRIKLTSI